MAFHSLIANGLAVAFLPNYTQIVALKSYLQLFFLRYKVSHNSSFSLSLSLSLSLQDMATLQADLAEAAMWRQRQEETLHQRERELTALKGALKEEVESHDGELETLREQYSQDMENLRRTMEQVSQVGERERERHKRDTSVVDPQPHERAGQYIVIHYN